MLARLLITASFAALLSAAPAVAQKAQDQGVTSQDGQSGQVIKKKKMIQPEGQKTGEATGSKQPKQDQATSQEGQATNKKLKKSQQATGEQPAGGQTTKKKKAQQSSDQMTTGATGKVETELTPEKKTIIRQKIVTKNVRRIDPDKIDFDISVGVVVPTTTIHLQPLPADIIELVPAYRGYLFFVLADGTIVIVEPRSHEIVFVLTA